MKDVERLREAIRLTREYVGARMLPALPGWSWFDAIAATGGFEGFGACGCVLDPRVHGRTADGELRYCDLPAAHEGDHGRLSSRGGGATVVRWRSRGIGLELDLTCFVCGAARRNPDTDSNSAMHNVAALVAKADERAVLACFEQGVRMGYYHGDRSMPQVKVGACDAHRIELEILSSQWFVSSGQVHDLVRWGQRRTAAGGAS